MDEYLFESAVWSVGGLLLGYVLGKIERTVTDIWKRGHPDAS